MGLFAAGLARGGGAAFGFGGERRGRGRRLRVDLRAALFAFEAGNFIAQALVLGTDLVELGRLGVEQIEQLHHQRPQGRVGNRGRVNMVQHG